MSETRLRFESGRHEVEDGDADVFGFRAGLETVDKGVAERGCVFTEVACDGGGRGHGGGDDADLGEGVEGQDGQLGFVGVVDVRGDDRDERDLVEAHGPCEDRVAESGVCVLDRVVKEEKVEHLKPGHDHRLELGGLLCPARGKERFDRAWPHADDGEERVVERAVVDKGIDEGVLERVVGPGLCRGGVVEDL